MVLQVPEGRVARPEVSDVVFLHRTAGGGGMGIRTANKALPEGVQPAVLLKRQSILEHIAHHVAAMEARNIDRKAAVRPHLAVHTTQHGEVIGRYLLEVTQLILGINANARQAIKAAL